MQFKGPLTENYVLQQLRGQLEVEPRYYADKNSEIDFVVQNGLEIIPMEVKGGEKTNRRRHSKSTSPITGRNTRCVFPSAVTGRTAISPICPCTLLEKQKICCNCVVQKEDASRQCLEASSLASLSATRRNIFYSSVTDIERGAVWHLHSHLGGCFRPTRTASGLIVR